MREPVQLSVVVITKNEHDRLAECLESVRWAGEIVIVDDESTDETVAVARRYTSRILTRRMEIEGIHRNFAYAQARYEWVFSLDADERVTPELAEEIRQLLTGTPPFDIYAVPRRNYIGKRWIRQGGWYPSPQVKLFKRSVFRWEETTVHPRAISDRPWGALKSDLIHYSYRDISDFIGKLNRQTTLEAQKWVLDGRRMGLGTALWRSLDRFFRTYWSKKSRQEGYLGFLIAAFAGFYQYLSFVKYWHRKGAAGNQPPAHQDPAETSTPSGIGTHTGLSVVILTKNAAPTIQRCLDSVRGLGEIIVVDGGSTDGTLEACRAAGAIVAQENLSDNFGELRNIGARRASGEWVLQLDADEVVTPEFRTILGQLSKNSQGCAAYKFHRSNFFLGQPMRFGGWDHDSLHLFKRGKARYEGRVHEKLLVDGPIGTLRVGVEHYPFRSIEEFINRQNRYTSLEARQMKETKSPAPMKTIWWQSTAKPLKLFWKIMVKKSGFRNGIIGFHFAILYAFVHLMKWAKVWELQNLEEKTALH